MAFRLISLQNKMEQINEVPTGLERLISNIDADEILATTDITFMLTAAQRSYDVCIYFYYNNFLLFVSTWRLIE